MTDQKYQPSSQQWALAGLLAAGTLGVLFYRYLQAHSLHQSAALYIGLPALLAIVLTLTPRSKSAYGMVIKGITILLLASIVALGEGVVCVLFAAPIFYLVGLFFASCIEWDKRRAAKGHKTNTTTLALIPLLLMSFEGITPATSFERMQSATVEQIIPADIAAVEASLAAPLHFDEEALPVFLQLGFPFPAEAEGAGLEVGDQRTVRYIFDSGHVAELHFVVIERGPGYARMRPMGERSFFDKWIGIGDSEIRWEAIDDGQTLVSWTIHYERLLDPAWYFGPLENYAMQLTSGYLIQSQASP